MRLAVVGSRNCESPRLVASWLDKMRLIHGNDLVIVSGGARGVDTLAAIWADKNGVDTDIYEPDWDTHGKSAGYRRNVTIWDNADAGIAFWDGQSKGTAHSFELARIQAKPCLVVLTHPQSLRV